MEFDKVLDGAYLRTVLALTFENIRAVYLRMPGGGFVELLEYRGIERLPAAARPCDPGGGHLCLKVSVIDRMVEDLRSAGFLGRSDNPVDIDRGPNQGARSIYMRDPDGYWVELFQPPSRVG
jgi:catechol 2,3-dioxygenase-like lactoylglutathione lyase family enzyme